MPIDSRLFVATQPAGRLFLANDRHSGPDGVPRRPRHVLPGHRERRRAAVRPVPRRPAGLPQGDRRPQPAFADFGGNRQYISVGNLSENPTAFLFLMDYAISRRVKVWGTATVVEGDPELLAKLSDPTYPGRVERAIVFTVEAWDVNCPQHIHKRFSQRQVAPVIEQLRARIAGLEAQLTSEQSRHSE